MNINEYESQVNAAMEDCDYGSDDIILGDIETNIEFVSDIDANAIMEAVLESLCDMDDETLTKTISELDDDSVCAIFAAATETLDASMEDNSTDIAALEAGGGNGGGNGSQPKPPKLAPAPKLKKLTSADVIAQSRSSGGFLGNMKDSLLASGRNKLDAATIDAIHDLGTKSGTNAYKRNHLMTSKATEQDKLRVGASLDVASKNNKDAVLAMVKSKTKDPRAIAAAMDLYKKSSSAQVSNHQAHSMAMSSWKEAHKTQIDEYKKKRKEYEKNAAEKEAKKKYDEKFKKKYPELWKQQQKLDAEHREDEAFDRISKIGNGKYKDLVDNMRHESEKTRERQAQKDREIETIRYLMKHDPKRAKKMLKEDYFTRSTAREDRKELVDKSKENVKQYAKNLWHNEMPTFERGVNNAVDNAKYVKHRLGEKSQAYGRALANGQGLGQAIKDFITASTGEETGLLSDIDVGLVMESISENGFGAYAFALEKAYRVMDDMMSMTDDEFDECMNAMSCTEAIELTENVNFICDILDDYEDYISCIEAAIQEIDYATEDSAPAPNPDPNSKDQKPKDPSKDQSQNSPAPAPQDNKPAPAPAPAPAPQNQNQNQNQNKPKPTDTKPNNQNQQLTIGQRVKNFFTGSNTTSGFKDRVKSMATGLKDRVSKWWNGTPAQNKPTEQKQNTQNQEAKKLTPEQEQQQHKKDLKLQAAEKEAREENRKNLKTEQIERFKAGAQAVDKEAQSNLKEELMKKHAAKLAQKNLDAQNGGDAAKFGKTVSQSDIDAAQKQIHNNAVIHQKERNAETRAAQKRYAINKARETFNNVKDKTVAGAKKVYKVLNTPITFKKPTPANSSVGADFDEDAYNALMESLNFIEETRDIYTAFESMSADEINAAFESMSVEEATMVRDIFEVNDIIEAFESAYEMLADESATMEDISEAFNTIYDSNYGAAFECYVVSMLSDIDDVNSDEVLNEALESMSMDEFAKFLDSCSYDELLAIESIYCSEDDDVLADVAKELLSLDSDAMESVVTSLDPMAFDIIMDALTEVISQ